MKIREVLNKSKKTLQKSNIKSPALEAEILLSAILQKDRKYLLTHPEKNISFWQNFLFQRLIRKRLAGYSSAVLNGHKWFYGLDFFVNKNVLVPRPETELILESIKNAKLKIKNIIDVGTGSGCIIITLVKLLINQKINFYGLDISRKALRVAKKNAKRHEVDGCIKFLPSDLLSNIDFKKLSGPIIITANLPYLTPEQIKNSPSIRKEPLIALESRPDGLEHYRRLFQQLNNPSLTLPKEGIKLFCEIDESHATAFSELVKKEFPNVKLTIKKDLNNADRLVALNILF